MAKQLTQTIEVVKGKIAMIEAQAIRDQEAGRRMGEFTEGRLDAFQEILAELEAVAQ